MIDNLSILEVIFYITGIICFIVVIWSIPRIKSILYDGITVTIDYLHAIQLNLADLDGYDFKEVRHENGSMSYLKNINNNMDSIMGLLGGWNIDRVHDKGMFSIIEELDVIRQRLADMERKMDKKY